MTAKGRPMRGNHALKTLFMEQELRTACTRHCGDGCGLIATVDENGLRALRGDPGHPFTRGVMCAKTSRFARRLYDPKRILTPLIRQGDGFREADWDEALELIAGRIDGLRAEPGRMLHLMGSASFGLLFRASRRLFRQLGASGFSGGLCLSAGMAAIKRDFGAAREAPLATIARARRIVNWGRNAVRHSSHLSRLIAEARENGARTLSIHPGDQGYASISDEQIVIRPGTDRFLAAAVLRILLDRGAVSQAALSRCFEGAAFLDMLSGLRLDDLLAACGLGREQAELAAGWYGGEAPVATLIGRGVQRYLSGGENVRYIDALAMLSGQIGREGGGVYFRQGDLGGAAWDWTEAQPGFSRLLRMADLAREMDRADPPVDLVWIEGVNAVTQCPDSRAMAKAFSERFTVVVEPFMTDAARCATVILPPALMLECEDVLRSDFHEYVQHAARVVPPRGLARSNFEIAAALGARLDPPVVFPDAGTVMDQALSRGKLKASFTELAEKGRMGVEVPASPWRDGVFAHPDGLYRLPGALHDESAPPSGYPFRLLTPVCGKYLLSQIPEEEQEGPQRVFVAPDSAALAGLDPGRPVRLVTPLGGMPVEVIPRPGTQPETIVAERGGWMSKGRCVNALIEARETDMGGQVAYYAQYARLENA